MYCTVYCRRAVGYVPLLARQLIVFAYGLASLAPSARRARVSSKQLLAHILRGSGEGFRTRPLHMPKPNTNTDDADIVNLPTPCWDTSDTGRAAHLRALSEWLPRKHPRFKKLVEFGYIVDRQSVCCVSENHIDLSLQGLIPKGSWLEPFFVHTQ